MSDRSSRAAPRGSWIEGVARARALAGAAFTLLLVAGSAHAQTLPSSRPLVASPPPPTFAQPADQAALDLEYDDAIAAFSRGDDATALRELDDVAARTVSPSRRASALALAAHIKGSPPSGAGTAKGPASAPGTALPAPPVTSGEEGSDGRLLLLGGSTLMGIAAYGPSAAYLFGQGSSRAEVGIELLFGGASFFIPYFATVDQPVSMAAAVLADGGAMLGFAQGALLGEALDMRSGKSFVGLMNVVSLAEGIGGYFFATDRAMSESTADAIVSGEFFGLGVGAGTSVLLQLDHQQNASQLVSGVALAGSLLGGLGGALIAGDRSWSPGDVGAIDNSVLLGAYGGGVLANDLGYHSADGLVTGLLAGGALGLLGGDRLVAGEDLSKDQAGFLGLGLIAGGLVGSGLAYAVAPSGVGTDSAVKIYTTSAVLGALGGFALTWHMLDLVPTGKAAPLVSWQLAPYAGPQGQQGLLVAGTF